MRPFRQTAIAVALLPFFVPTAWGLGLGEITMLSYLNEPLRAEVVLLDAQDMRPEDIKIRIATQDDFDRLGVDRAYFLTSIQFDVVINGDASKVVLRTEEPLVEPYLDFLLETRWPQGRLLRGYTVLVDLPRQINTPTSAAATSASSISTESGITDRASVAATNTIPVNGSSKRSYDKAAEERPRAGGQYLVQAKDTLWEIATAARPANATIEQTMVATVAMNGDAFTGSNINGLKAGYVLELPSEREILLSTAEAVNEVAQQNADWTAGIRRTRAVRVVAEDTPDSATSEADASFVRSGDATVDAGAGEDVGWLADNPAQAAGNGDFDVRENEAVAGAEASDLVAIETRLAALAAQMSELRQLVTVKDQQIAALQAELAVRDAALAAASQAATASAPAVVPTPSDGLPWWLWVLGGVVVVSVAGVVITRWTNNHGLNDSNALLTDEFDALDSEPVAPKSPTRPRTNDHPSADISATVERRVSSDGHADARSPTEAPERTSTELPSASRTKDSAMADALAEADIYVAYGRYQQALDVLESAAKIESDGAAPYLKMIEIYLKNDRFAEAQALMPAIERTADAGAIAQAKRVLADATPAVSIDSLTIDGDDANAVNSVASTLDTLDLEPMTESSTPVEADDKGVDEQSSRVGGLAMDALDLDLDLDLEIAELSAEPQFEEQASALTDSENADSGAADWGDAGDENVASFDQNKLPPELAAVLGSEIPPPFEETDDDEESGLIYSVETDPMDTKLDLARAYIDMGDEDGARPVLEDVINKGDLRQQAEARELLVRID